MTCPCHSDILHKSEIFIFFPFFVWQFFWSSYITVCLLLYSIAQPLQIMFSSQYCYHLFIPLFVFSFMMLLSSPLCKKSFIVFAECRLLIWIYHVSTIFIFRSIRLLYCSVPLLLVVGVKGHFIIAVAFLLSFIFHVNTSVIQVLKGRCCRDLVDIKLFVN